MATLADERRATAWHETPVGDAIERMQSDLVVGLDSAEAERRISRWGANELSEVRRTSWATVAARQFTDALILLLLGAASVAALLREWWDALTIVAIIILNGVLGFVQEWRAERTLTALRKLQAPRCRVLRAGVEQEIPATSLVPGDLVLLAAGDRTPADLRIVRALSLQMDESTLTGESAPVEKQTAPVPGESTLPERASMAWAGSHVTNGRGRGLVVATGMQTELGRLAALTQTVSPGLTPLQRQLARLGRRLGAAAIGVSLLIAVIGGLTGKGWLEMFMTGVSLAVAAVPEGLPAVVTISLALGVRALARRRALIRRLPVAESLGGATYICTDKTGTLTENQMTVRRLWLADGELHVTGDGYAPEGEFRQGDRVIAPLSRPDLALLLETARQCNHAQLKHDEAGWSVLGDRTEAALLTLAWKAGLPPEERLETLWECSFNSRRKRMSVIVQAGEQETAHVKGAPEILLPLCSRLRRGADDVPLTESDRRTALAASAKLAAAGMRTLALARRQLPAPGPREPEAVEADLTLLGIVGILDPPRKETAAAVREAREAGIRVVMITGDAPGTALAIAKQVGLPAGRAVTGADFAGLTDAELRAALASGALFARTSPEDKLRLVTLLQQQGEVVAMTGDGVNDSPALKKADIGIAMGRTGADVARHAADMVLTDDNFATILAAVEEGRRHYDNLQKFVLYLLSSNTGELLAIFLNILVGGPLLLLPVQILWMNLVTDGLTAVTLSVEPAEPGLMQRPPRPPREPLLNRPGIALILALGGFLGLFTLLLYQLHVGNGDPSTVARARTIAFTGIILAEKLNVLNYRTLRAPLISVGFWSNPWLIVAIVVTIGLQVGAVYLPTLQRALHTVPLSGPDWLVALAALPIIAIAEAVKAHGRSRHQPAAPDPVGRAPDSIE